MTANLLFLFLALLPLTAIVLYPMAIKLLSILQGPAIDKPRVGDLPSVTLVISAYNEEHVIETKLENSLNIDYPKDKLEIFVVSDGSNDATNEIVGRFAEHGVRLLSWPHNRGKSVALNDAVAEAKHDILVFSDANSMYHPLALRKLAPWFADERVGSVCGRLVYIQQKHNGAEEGEIAYWNADAKMKNWESHLGSVIAGNGAILGMRREALIPLVGELSNDFIWTAASRYMGYRNIYEDQAIAFEAPAGSIGSEFRRKVRIQQRGLHVHNYVLDFWNRGIRAASIADAMAVLLQMGAKKLCRYLTFPAIAMMMIVGLFAASPLIHATTIALWAMLAIAAFATALRPILRKSIPSWPGFEYPLAMAAASFGGWYQYLSGKKLVSWGKERGDDVELNSTLVRQLESKFSIN